MKKRITSTPAETEIIGLLFAESIDPGTVVGLYGDLGSGKTCFVRGAAKAFHVRDRITSPTYSLINVYHGDCPVFHMDAFRLKSPDEMVSIGFEEYVRQPGVCFIEWAERIEALLPEKTRRVHFRVVDETRREISLE